MKKHIASIQKNQSTSQDDVFMKPDPTKVTGMRHGSYDKLNDRGFVPEETKIENGDIIIGKVSPIQPVGNSNKTFKDSSEVYRSHVPGVIDKVYTNIYNSDGYEMRKVRTRSERKPRNGDKFCIPETANADVLTYTGWKNIKDITKNDLIATLTDNKYLKYVKPIDVYNWNYEGDIYQLRSQQVDLDVTMDHELYVKRRDKKEFELIQAKDIMGKRYNLKKNCEYLNDEIKELILPEYLNSAIKKPSKKIDYDAFLEFLGIFIADGCIYNNCIQIAGEKQRKINHLREVCSRLNINIQSDKKKNSDLNSYGLGCNHKLYDIQLLKYIEELNVGALTKYLPDYVWKLNQRQARILLNSLISCDGSKNNQGSVCYYTSSKRLANDVMRLAIHAGWSASIKLIREKGSEYKIQRKDKLDVGVINADTLSIRINKTKNEPQINHGHKNNQNGQSERTYYYKGKVYCLEVPSHVFMVRQNNKNVWIGNCSRHGQKGTIGITLNQSDMPFTKDGITPDICLNPHAIPSRMTVAQLIETLVGKKVALDGTEADGTPFNEINVESIKDALEKYGYERNGFEYLYNGMTGEKLKVMICIGPTYYQRLKHQVEDKIHSRARGPRTLLTRQAPEGRSRDGGLRLGEMERDSLLAHGMSLFLKEKLLDTSDAYSTYVCDKCGLFAQRLYRKGNQSHATSKDVYFCQSCKNYTEISKIMIPYAFKLLIQEMMSMDIAARIRVKKDAFGN